jgi:hypothetical protein
LEPREWWKNGGGQTIEHDRCSLARLADIARLFLQFADSTLLGCLALVDQAGGDLDADRLYGRAVLFLEDDLRSWSCVKTSEGKGRKGDGFVTCLFLEDGHDANTVYVGILGTGGALCGLPGSNGALGVPVGSEHHLGPYRLALGLSSRISMEDVGWVVAVDGLTRGSVLRILASETDMISG